MNKQAFISFSDIGALWNGATDLAKTVLLAGLGVAGAAGYAAGRGASSITAHDKGDYENADKEYKLNRLKAENNRITAMTDDEFSRRAVAQPYKSMRI